MIYSWLRSATSMAIPRLEFLPTPQSRYRRSACSPPWRDAPVLLHVLRAIPEVETEQSVPIPRAAVVANDGGRHELVGDIMGICVRDRRVRIGKAWPLRIDDRLVGLVKLVSEVLSLQYFSKLRN